MHPARSKAYSPRDRLMVLPGAAEEHPTPRRNDRLGAKGPCPWSRPFLP